MEALLNTIQEYNRYLTLICFSVLIVSISKDTIDSFKVKTSLEAKKCALDWISQHHANRITKNSNKIKEPDCCTDVFSRCRHDKASDARWNIKVGHFHCDSVQIGNTKFRTINIGKGKVTLDNFGATIHNKNIKDVGELSLREIANYTSSFAEPTIYSLTPKTNTQNTIDKLVAKNCSDYTCNEIHIMGITYKDSCFSYSSNIVVKDNKNNYDTLKFNIETDWSKYLVSDYDQAESCKPQNRKDWAQPFDAVTLKTLEQGRKVSDLLNELALEKNSYAEEKLELMGFKLPTMFLYTFSPLAFTFLLLYLFAHLYSLGKIIHKRIKNKSNEDKKTLINKLTDYPIFITDGGFGFKVLTVFNYFILPIFTLTFIYIKFRPYITEGGLLHSSYWVFSVTSFVLGLLAIWKSNLIRKFIAAESKYSNSDW